MSVFQSMLPPSVGENVFSAPCVPLPKSASRFLVPIHLQFNVLLLCRSPNTEDDYWCIKRGATKAFPALLAQHDTNTAQIQFHVGGSYPPSDPCSLSCLSAIINPKQAKDNKSFNFDYSYWSHTTVTLSAPHGANVVHTHARAHICITVDCFILRLLGF